MTTLRLLVSPGFRTDQCSWYSFRTCWHLRLFSGLHLSQAFSEALTKIYFSAIDIKSTTLLRRVMFYWGNMRGLLEAARNILASLQKFTWMHIICWTVHKWFTEGFTGFSVVGCLSRLHWENAQCTAQHKLTLQCDINNNRVEKLPGIVFSYETIPPPIVSGRKQLKSRSVGYAREKRFPTFQHRQTLEPHDNSQAEAARLHRPVIVRHVVN